MKLIAYVFFVTSLSQPLYETLFFTVQCFFFPLTVLNIISHKQVWKFLYFFRKQLSIIGGKDLTKTTKVAKEKILHLFVIICKLHGLPIPVSLSLYFLS